MFARIASEGETFVSSIQNGEFNVELSPGIIDLITVLASTTGGAVAGWFMAARKANLELRNQSQMANVGYLHASNLQELAQYITRKHRVVAELHKRLMDEKSTILSLEVKILRPQLERANTEDIRRYMQEHEVLEASKKRCSHYGYATRRRLRRN